MLAQVTNTVVGVGDVCRPLCQTMLVLTAVAEYWRQPAIHIFHKCHHGVRQVHLYSGDWCQQQRGHCRHGLAYHPDETTNHSRVSFDEPGQQSDCSEGHSTCCSWRQSADLQLGAEVQDEVIPDNTACCLLEVDYALKVGAGYSY